VDFNSSKDNSGDQGKSDPSKSDPSKPDQSKPDQSKPDEKDTTTRLPEIKEKTFYSVQNVARDSNGQEICMSWLWPVPRMLTSSGGLGPKVCLSSTRRCSV
jgi:hypothetical protein